MVEIIRKKRANDQTVALLDNMDMYLTQSKNEIIKKVRLLKLSYDNVYKYKTIIKY